MSQEEKEKSPRVELFCHSDYGRVGATGFDVDDCDEVGEGGILLTDALTSGALRHGRSIPIRTCLWRSPDKVTYLLQITVCYDAQIRNLKVIA